MPIKCFWLEPTERTRIALRRLVWSSLVRCDASGLGYHNAETLIGDRPMRLTERGNEDGNGYDADFPRADPRWPKVCACGYAFADADPWQVFTNRLYRRADTGEVLRLRDAPPGAMWDATWFNDRPEYTGPDGITLVVRCPDGHDWMVDSRARNCTLPQDNAHKCWVRHGDPRTGDIHVDKNGLTCAAGAGSIQTPNWHGFLRHGELVTC